MNYICNVSGDPIPEGKNVSLVLSPRGESENISDFNKEREHLNQRLMIHQDVAEILVKLIESEELSIVLAVWPPNRDGILEHLKTPFISGIKSCIIDDPKDHKYHRYPLKDCLKCQTEEFLNNV